MAMAQMGLFLDLPTRMPAMLRDAKVMDAQAGFETGMVATTTGLIADLMDGMQLDMDMVVDFPDLLFCDECMAGIQRMAREVVVDEASLAFDTMREVGPGGTFLGTQHTFQNFRQELWMPKLLERSNYESWRNSGALDIFKKCEEKLLALLEAPVDPLLTPEVEAQIDAIVEAAVNGNGG